ncbi:MAG: hypothetical protein N4A35_17105 [Flavobacteriales bacterium]|nr:hypothetical protein [Flavobacteriales bacterium]
MKKPNKDSIRKATERVMKRLPIDKLRKIKKFKNISEQDYLKLIKNAEKFALLVLALYSERQNARY